MKTYDGIIFDLDGTLWDPTVACAHAWNAVLKKRGYQFDEITPQDIKSICGTPIEAGIVRLLPKIQRKEIRVLAELLAQREREFLSVEKGRIYDGVFEGLKTLAQKFPLFIVSNCQEGYLEDFIAYAGIKDFIRDFESHGRTGLTKSQNILLLMKRVNLKSAVYIGDTDGDKEAAEKAGIDFIHASYGFSPMTKAKVKVESFTELCALLKINPFFR